MKHGFVRGLSGQRGFIARGMFAVILLAALGIALLWDTITGKATSSDYQGFGLILLLSAVATLIWSAISKRR